MPEIDPNTLTLTDLVGLGPDAVTDRLPTALLVALARRTVRSESAKRRRSEAARAERRARGTQTDNLDARARKAADDASLTMQVDWSDILDVPLHGPGEGRTWGNATAQDHLTVADRLEAEGATFLRSAAMHRRAARDLDILGATTLNDSTMGLR